MSKSLVPDDLWAVIAPLLPPEPPKPKGGRPRIPDRAALTGIVVVRRSGSAWELLPQEMGCGSGMTCWRRLRDGQQAGVWDRLHRVLLDRLGQADRIGWERAGLDRATVPAKRGSGDAQAVGADPPNRGKPGTTHHVVTVQRGTPLACGFTGANRHDPIRFDQMVDAIPPIRRPRGRPRRRPAKLHADTAYDDPRCRRALRRRHSKGRIARRGIESSERLGRHRWVVERTIALRHRFRRLRVRDERRADIHQAVLTLGCALLCHQAFHRLCWTL